MTLISFISLNHFGSGSIGVGLFCFSLSVGLVFSSSWCTTITPQVAHYATVVVDFTMSPSHFRFLIILSSMSKVPTVETLTILASLTFYQCLQWVLLFLSGCFVPYMNRCITILVDMTHLIVVIADHTGLFKCNWFLIVFGQAPKDYRVDTHCISLCSRFGQRSWWGLSSLGVSLGVVK